MKDLDLPTQCVPLHLFYCLTTRVYRQIGDKLPVYPFPVCRHLPLPLFDHRDRHFRIAFLLGPGRLNPQMPIADFQYRFRCLALAISHRDPIQPPAGSSFDGLSDGLRAAVSQPVAACAHQKVRP